MTRWEGSEKSLWIFFFTAPALEQAPANTFPDIHQPEEGATVIPERETLTDPETVKL